jgi:hypothetical protein
MNQTRQLFPLGGLVMTIAAAACFVVQMNAQSPAPTGDFTNAATAQVRNAAGQIVLEGPFMAGDQDDEDVERQATLVSTGIDADAAGEAEVEFAKAAPAAQEVEFSARNLDPGAAFTFVIDGVDVATATANQRGRVSVELDVRMR